MLRHAARKTEGIKLRWTIPVGGARLIFSGTCIPRSLFTTLASLAAGINS